MLQIYVKINHNSSRDVHSGTAADCAFPLHNPRAYRLPAIEPPCGPQAKMILKREILKGLKMTLLSQWVTATTESRLLLKTEAKCRDEIAALRSCCAWISPPRCTQLTCRQACAYHSSRLSAHISDAEYHAAKPGCIPEADRGHS